MLLRPRSKLRLPTRGIAVAALVLIGIPIGLAQQFHFILRNGDRLTGVVVAEDRASVIISNSLIGRILIPASQLERREAAAPPAVVTTPPPPPAAPPTNARPVLSKEQQRRLDDLLEVYLAGQVSPAEFQRRREALLSPPRPAGPKRWSGELFAGLDLGYGTKSRQYFSGRAKINFTDKRLRNTLDYLFTYGHTEGQLSANRMDATDKADYELDASYYLYALAGAGHDEIRKIDYYLQAGPGLGRHLVKRTNFVLNAEVGANYQLQNFAGAEDTYVFYYRLAQDSKWIITPRLTFDEKVEYTPQWNRFDEFKIRAEANLRFWLLENLLSLNLTVIDLYDTRIAPGINRNDLQIRSSIGVKF